MSRHGHDLHAMLPARTPVLLLLVVLLLGACGQKGDLYRPGKSQKLAAHAEVSART